MSHKKKPANQARGKAGKARRQARLAIGPVPPQSVIESKKSRPPKHKKRASRDEET